MRIAKQKKGKEKGRRDKVGGAISTANSIKDKAKKVNKLHKIAVGTYQGYKNAKKKVSDISKKTIEWNIQESKRGC